MNDQQTQAAAPAARPGRRWLIIVVVVVIIAIAVLVYWLITRGWASTDDAQIRGNLVPINARVNGYIDRIYVTDNQPVEAGRILVQLDSRDLRARLRAAEANLATLTAQASGAAAQVALVERTAPAGQEQAGAAATAAGAGVAASQSQIASAEAQAAAAQAAADAAREAISGARSDVVTASAQIESARAALQAAQANVSSAQAQANKAASDAARSQQLYNRGAISKQQLETAQATNISAQAALKAAREGVNSAIAAVAQARARKTAAEAALKQAISRAASAQATANQAQAGVRTARTTLSEAEAGLAGAQAGLKGAQTVPEQLAIGRAQNKAAAARIRQAMADVRNARLQLSYTQITAPVSGIVSQKAVEPGQFVQPGQTLMSVVPLKNVWVVANFKETQIGHMKPGQSATITVDTYPGRKFYGKIDSIGAATGAQFSVLPPENATGNFVKVVQRIPVKIVFDRPLPRGVVLRPGMNVVANVNTRGGRG